MNKEIFIENILSRFNPLSISKQDNTYIFTLDDCSVSKMELDGTSAKGEVLFEEEDGSKSEMFQKYFFSYSPTEDHKEYLDELYSKIGSEVITNKEADGTKLVVINNLTKEEVIYDILFGYKKFIDGKLVETSIITKGSPINEENPDDFGPFIFKIINNKIVFWNGWLSEDFYLIFKDLKSNEVHKINENFEERSYIKLSSNDINELTYNRAFLR